MGCSVSQQGDKMDEVFLLIAMAVRFTQLGLTLSMKIMVPSCDRM